MQAEPPIDYRFTSHGFERVSAPSSASPKLHTYKGAYVAITSSCNTDICSYCYARTEKKGEPISVERFETILEWLADVSDFPEVYLVGGEPTTVPHLPELLDAVARRGWRATIYTNGAFNAGRREELCSHPGLGRMAFHYEPMFFSHYQNFRTHWIENIAGLSMKKECSLVFVIMSALFDYEDVLNIASAYGIAVTWVFAAPSAGGTPYLGLKAMRRAGPRVQDLLLAAKTRGVKIAPDLPVPLCVFDDQFRAEHQDEFKLSRRCEPFAYFRSDLAIQSCTVMPCNNSVTPNSSAELRQIILKHRARDQTLKKKPSFPECVNCMHHLNGTCQGGCMTYKLYARPEVEL